MYLSLYSKLRKTLLCLLLLAICGRDVLSYQSPNVEANEDSVHKNILVYELFNQIYASLRKSEVKLAPMRALPHVEIFGWHPGWSTNTFRDYNYNTLTTLSYSEATITLKNGELTLIAPNWSNPSTEELIALAEEGNTRVLLTIKCTSAAAYAKLFSDQPAKTSVIEQILSLVVQHQDVSGVSIVFEQLPPENSIDFVNFIASLGDSLKKIDKSMALSLPALPKPVHSKILQVDSLIDRYVLQAYNYQARNKPSPVAPLLSSKKWGPLSIDNSIQRYLDLGIRKEKLIVTLPYFGARWTPAATSTKYRAEGRPDYKQIMAEVNDSTLITYDSTSMTAILQTSIEGKSYTYYFDDEKTLQHKFNWIIDKGLAGVGIWALGYDDKRPELWQMLADSLNPAQTFNKPTISSTWYPIKPEAISNPFKLKPDEVLEKAKGIAKQKEVLLASGILLLGFIIVAFIITLTDSAVYERIFITEWSLYLKICASLLAFVLVCIIVSNFVFESDPQIANKLEPYLNEPVLVSGKVIVLIIKYGLLAFGIISLLSWKVFLKINTDLP